MLRYTKERWNARTYLLKTVSRPEAPQFFLPQFPAPFFLKQIPSVGSARISSYDEALAFLNARLNYERTAAEKVSVRDFKPDRMQRLLALLGNPQNTIPAVHIAGTKGKGSTAVMVAEILQAGGYRTGLFTSPHVRDFEERMQVNGRCPPAETLVALTDETAEAVEHLDRLGPEYGPTYFEIAMAMAWQFFRRECCDFVVLEVGLGGRLDATNICHPEVTVLTNVSRDHMHLLGNTPAEIAAEKAGIIKSHIPVVSGVLHPAARKVIRDTTREHSADLYELQRDIRYLRRRTPEKIPAAGSLRALSGSFLDVETPFTGYENLPLTLAGAHQAANAALAVSAVDVLRRRGYPVPAEAVSAGLSAVRWPIRLEVLGTSPLLIADAAHNEASVTATVRALREEFPAGPRTLLFGVSRDKDVEQLAAVLFPHFDRIILTRFLGNPRAVDPEELEQRTAAFASGELSTADDPKSAVNAARLCTPEHGLICATGSFYLAAEVRTLLCAEEPATETVPPPAIVCSS